MYFPPVMDLAPVKLSTAVFLVGLRVCVCVCVCVSGEMTALVYSAVTSHSKVL